MLKRVEHDGLFHGISLLFFHRQKKVIKKGEAGFLVSDIRIRSDSLKSFQCLTKYNLVSPTILAHFQAKGFWVPFPYGT